MGNFKEDLKLEDRFYAEIFKPWLRKNNWDSIFIQYNNNSVFNDLQKKDDVDVILDTGKENITLSLKTTRVVYDSIFFETVSNCNTGTAGWGYYSKADYIVYSSGSFEKGFIARCFSTADILKLNLGSYAVRYGKTFSYGKLLYKTEGRIVPVNDFNHTILFNTIV